MFNVTWIIGNGFDVNVGMKTGYRSFLDNVYLNRDIENELRDDLIGRVGENPFLEKGTHWSDLESLLAYATQFYREDDEELFHDAFEDMQRMFVQYVGNEEQAFRKELPHEWLVEFWSSVCNLRNRMVPADRARFFSSDSIVDSIRYRFVSLNYTCTLDRFLSEGEKASAQFENHSASGTVFRDGHDDVFHLHGMIRDGEAQEIVFGTSFPDQIMNKALAVNDDFRDMWLKTNKNESIYGNDKTARLHETIASSNVICIYGCSLGESDAYIWHEIADNLKASEQNSVVLFVHGLPDRLGQYSRSYQRAKREAVKGLANATGLSDDEVGTLQNRLIVLASSDVFRFNLEAGGTTVVAN